MKLKILTVDFYLRGENIDRRDFIDAPSFADYDVLIIDPINIPKIWKQKTSPDQDGSYISYATTDAGFSKGLEAFMISRAEETKLLLEVIGGVVIIFLRTKGSALKYKESKHLAGKFRQLHSYSWLPSLDFAYMDKEALSSLAGLGDMSLEGITSAATPGEQNFTKVTCNFPGYIFNPKFRSSKAIEWYDKVHPFAQYFSGFEGEISSEAVVDDQRLLNISRPIARNKAKEVIAFELLFSRGKIIFLPPLSEGVTAGKVAGILIDCIRKSLDWTKPIKKPLWADKLQLSGEPELRQAISNIEEEIKMFEGNKREKEKSLDKFEKIRGLLYEKGKYGLEPCVRESFRILGFNVLEPDQYEEEFDLYTKEDGLIVLGEIEGSTGQVDVEKFRQLHDYVTEEDLKGIECKGILIGNGFCEIEPDKRDEQFTTHAIRGCKRQRYCRMTTYELFKAVSAVLLDPLNTEYKNEIKQKIISCEDEFNFEEPKEEKNLKEEEGA